MRGESATGVRPYIFLGFSLYETWKYLVLFLGSSLAHQVNYVVSLSTLVVSLAALLAFYPVIFREQSRIRLSAVAATVLLVASAALTASPLAEGAIALHAASGLASGIGTAVLDVLWISRLASCNQRQFLLFAVCFVAAQSLLTYLLVSAPSDFPIYAFALPVLSCAMLWSTPEHKPFPTAPGKPPATWYGAAWGVFGLSIGILCALSRIMDNKDMATSPWMLAITLTVLAVFFYLNRKTLGSYLKDRDREAIAIMVVLPLLVLFLMGAPYVFIGYPELQIVRVASSFALWELFLVYIAVTLSQRLNMPLAQLYLYLNIGRSAGVLAGTGITYLVTTFLTATSGIVEQLAMAVVVLACQIMLVLSFTVSKRQIEEVASAQPNQPLDLASAIIARRYLLTPREEEILKLVAKGRTVPRISEELFISPSTTTTHMNHIYKKCDVHTKQQLLDLCESALSEKD